MTKIMWVIVMRYYLLIEYEIELLRNFLSNIFLFMYFKV